MARAAERMGRTTSRGAVGTPAYMAPEQARDTREASVASDVYSLGATLLFAATGHAPYAGASVMDVLARLASEHGHMAEVVELGDGGLAIRHCNCPIQDVAARTGLPCVNEQQMYERLLGTDVARTTWMAEANDDCTYVMKEKEKQIG